MYADVLWIHSWVRWLAVLAGVVALVRAMGGLRRARAWSRADRAAAAAYTGALDLQLVLGLALYGLLSPMTAAAFADFGAAMRSPPLRFWAVEHSVLGVAAVVLAHAGQIVARRREGAARFRAAAAFVGASLLCALAAIPWPVREALGRPWIRGF